MPMIGDVLYLPETEVNPYKKQEYGPNNGGSYEDFAGSTEGRKASINIRKYISERYGPMVDKAAQDKEAEYIEKRASVPGTIHNEVEAEKLANPASGSSTSERLVYEASIRESLATKKTMELPLLQTTANSFYRDNFFNYQIRAFFVQAYKREFGRISDTAETYQAWLNSFNAAYAIKVLNDEIELLNKESSWFRNQAEQARLAAEAERVAAEQARIAAEAIAKAAAEAEAKRVADEQAKYEDAIKFTASFYKEVAEKFGEKASTLAQELAESAKGKTIRSADEAFKAFDKYKDVLDKKFNAKDREAIVKLIDSVDFDAVGKSAAKFSKGFGYVGPAMDAKDAYIEFGKSQASGDWKPFFVKLETIGLGLAATALVGAMFGFAAVTPVGILGFAALMAVTGAAIDDKLVGNINSFIMDM